VPGQAARVYWKENSVTSPTLRGAGLVGRARVNRWGRGVLVAMFTIRTHIYATPVFLERSPSRMDTYQQELVARRVTQAAKALAEALEAIPPELREICRRRPRLTSDGARRAVGRRWARHREMEARRRGESQGGDDSAA
jgi:hypothetical protein